MTTAIVLLAFYFINGILLEAVRYLAYGGLYYWGWIPNKLHSEPFNHIDEDKIRFDCGDFYLSLVSFVVMPLGLLFNLCCLLSIAVFNFLQKRNA